LALTTDTVTEEALSLPADARLKLVDTLIASLNLPIQQEVDRLWAEEAERRMLELDRGEKKLVPSEEVFARIRAKYSR
jgi:putative addiction module component (TIGR02574 family)